MLITLSFLAGVVATVVVIRLYPMLRNSQLAELVVIAVQNRWTSGRPRSAPRTAPDETQAEKERAVAARLSAN